MSQESTESFKMRKIVKIEKIELGFGYEKTVAFDIVISLDFLGSHVRVIVIFLTKI